MLELKNISNFIDEYINMMLYYVSKNKDVLEELSDIETIINNCNGDSLKLVNCPLNIFCLVIDKYVKYNNKFIKSEFTKAKYIEKNYKVFTSSDYGKKQIENRNIFLNDIYTKLKEIVNKEKEKYENIITRCRLNIEKSYSLYDKIREGTITDIITKEDIEFLKHIFDLSKIDSEQQLKILTYIFKSNLSIQEDKMKDNREENIIKEQNIPVVIHESLLSKEDELYIKKLLEDYKDKFNYVDRLREMDTPLYLSAEKYKESYRTIEDKKELFDGLTNELSEIIIIISIQELIEELSLWEDEYQTGINKALIVEETQELLEKLKSYDNDYQLLRQSILKQYEKEDEEEILNDNPKRLVYLTTGHKGLGNVCFESGLKDISEEYYDDIVNMLEELKSGIVYNSNEKDKAFIGIRGYRERKDFKLRIIYRLLPNDTILITFVIPKKDNTLVTKAEIIKDKLSLYRDEINYIKDTVTNGGKEALELYEINEEIHQNIINYLQKNKRTRNR